jgi:hypothetical protein
MSTDAAQPSTPNDDLARLICDRLVEKDLIPNDRTQDTLTRLAKGTLRDRDWRLLLDLPVMQKERAHE